MSAAIGRHHRDHGSGPDVLNGSCPWCPATFPVDSLVVAHMSTCPMRPADEDEGEGE